MSTPNPLISEAEAGAALVLTTAATAPADRVTCSPAEAEASRLPLSEDSLVIAALVDELLSTLRLQRSAGLSTRLLATIGSAAQRTVQQIGRGRYNPGNPVDDSGLTRALRALLGYSSDRPPTMDEAGSLARAGVAHLARALNLAVDGLKDLLAELPAGLVTEPEADAADPLMDILDIFWDEHETHDDTPIWEQEPTPPSPEDPLAKLLAHHRPRAVFAAMARPMVVRDVLALLDVGRLRKFLRAAVPWRARRRASEYAKAFARERYTSADGYAAETILRTLYLDRCTGRDVLVGTRVSNCNGKTIAGRLLDAAADTDALWDTVRTALLSFVTGGIGQPDILDPYAAPGVGHVYEIKPARRTRNGAKQLYGRYLFWLNLAEVANTNGEVNVLEAAAWAARLCSGQGSTAPFPANGRTLRPLERIWMPGDWIPPKQMPYGDRVFRFDVPVPGVISYVVLRNDKEPQAQTAAVADLEQNAAMLAALMVAAVAAGDLNRPENIRALAETWQQHFADAPAATTTTGEWEALKSTLIVTVVVVGVGLALLALPLLVPVFTTAAASEIFVAGGTAALFAASTLAR